VTPVLGRKQTSDHEDFVRALDRIETIVSRDEVEDLVGRTAEEIRRRCAGRKAAFAWSGGKDSIALEHVCTAAGLRECVLVISDLEYPAFLRWVTDHMPPRLEVVSTGQDLAWLAANPGMLFPKDSATAGKWFKIVQHSGQARFYRQRKLDALLVGRRRADGNFVGPDGEYESKRIVRYSPIRDWRHEDVLAVIRYFDKPMPPCYEWPRGFRVGTGPWPARQWCGTDERGFAEVWTIDPDVVRGAAEMLPPARAFMERHGLR
jgi:3'-phosphoadenosine 5'-phosphosulfate sulfotransferase (PAPS reductase)/FAD synthetase